MKAFLIVLASLICLTAGSACPVQTNHTVQEETAAEITLSASNALKKAKQYLKVIPYSYKGLIKQLKFDGFSAEDAEYAADNCGADWDEQAVKKAKQYLKVFAYSEKQLIQQLKFEGFTDEQATYAAEQIGF